MYSFCFHHSITLFQNIDLGLCCYYSNFKGLINVENFKKHY